MCGIVGFSGLSLDNDKKKKLINNMCNVIIHRGPDDDGYYVNERIGLGMRRLSIIDVIGGKQPIYNEDHSLAIVFNGEIYNYRRLMMDLQSRGHIFQTHSDTETVIHLFEEYGIDCLDYLRGMFAFALYDKNNERIYLARDRLGIKPLYYWQQDGKLIFASEIKAILECEDVRREPNLSAIDSYLSLRYVPGPQTMFSGIYSLPSGHWLSFQHGQAQIVQYWKPFFSDGPYQSDAYYQERFSELFNESVRLHLESDVPLGAFLSGGVDSSAIVATMSQMINRPIEVFTVGFDWQGDELPMARQVASYLGCNYNEIICRAQDISLLPKVIWHLDQPVGDAIIIPMYLLSKLAQQSVKVVLSGEGADETLAGYLFHKTLFWAGKVSQCVPAPIIRNIIQPALARIPLALLNQIFSYPAQLGEQGRTKILDFINLVTHGHIGEQYRLLISLFGQREKNTLYTSSFASNLYCYNVKDSMKRKEKTSLNDILALSFEDWLQDDILMKADKISMANSIETRVPFMDHVLVEFLCQIPPYMKLKGWKEKRILRDDLKNRLPGKPSRQPKKAFYIPLDKFFATPQWNDLINSCLSETSIRKRGYFRIETIRFLRKSYQNGDFLYGKQLVSLIALELWHKIFIDHERGY